MESHECFFVEFKMNDSLETEYFESKLLVSKIETQETNWMPNSSYVWTLNDAPKKRMLFRRCTLNREISLLYYKSSRPHLSAGSYMQKMQSATYDSHDSQGSIPISTQNMFHFVLVFFTSFFDEQHNSGGGKSMAAKSLQFFFHFPPK